MTRGFSWGAILRPLAVVFALGLMLEAGRRFGVTPKTIPSPAELTVAFGRDMRSVLFHAQVTVIAALGGFCAAAVLCFTVVTLVALVPRLETFVYNMALILHALPLLVLAPILIIWFGLGIETRIIISAMAAYYAILMAGLHGLRAPRENVGELMQILGASRWQVTRKVIIPYAMPATFAGLKIGAAGAVLGAVIAEWTGAERGLGVLMAYSLFSFEVERVWLTMFAMMLLAFVAYSLVQTAERRLLSWHYDRSALGGLL